MKVSIAIAVYEMLDKGKFFLDRCIKSIISQNYSNIEIVVSDHSDNNELELLCNNFDFDIKYIKNEHGKGSSSNNFNNAIENCSGDVIKILCQDDILYDDNSIKYVVEKINTDENFKWLVSSYIHTKDFINYFNIQKPKIDQNIKPFVNMIGTHSCLTISKDVDIMFDNNLIWYMDCEYYYRLYLKYNEPFILNKITMVQSLWDGQVTNTLATEIKRKEEFLYIKNKKYG